MLKDKRNGIHNTALGVTDMARTTQEKGEELVLISSLEPEDDHPDFWVQANLDQKTYQIFHVLSKGSMKFSFDVPLRLH